MFKKPATLKPAAPLRSSARRAFLAHLQQLYPILAHATPDRVLEVVPNTLKQCGAKTSAGEKAVVYTDGSGTPLWLEVGHDAGAALVQSEHQRRKGAKERENTRLAEVIPTLYVVWLMPQLLPRLPTWPQIVDPVLLGGSALMIPGLIPSPNTFPRSLQWPPPVKQAEGEAGQEETVLQDLKRNALVSITAYPSSVPMAIARLEEDVSKLILKRSAGEKGKAAVMLQCKGDALMAISPIPIAAPSDLEIQQRDVVKQVVEAHSDLEGMGEQLALLSMSNGDSVNDAADEGEDRQDELCAGLSAGQVDEILYLGLLMALHRMTDDQLPMNCSAFYSGHVLPNRPAHWPPRKVKGTRRSEVSSSFVTTAPAAPEAVDATNADLRHSSFKKLAKWLKIIERKGLIKTKEAKGKDQVLVSIDRRHEDLVDLAEFCTFADVATTETDDKSKSSSADQSASQDASVFAIRMENFWRAGPSSVKLFQQMNCTTSVPLSREQIRQAILDYVSHQDLIDPRNKANIKIADPHLTHALYPKAALNEIPPVLRRDEILDMLLTKSCIEYHRTSRLLLSRGRAIDIDTISDLKEGESIGPILSGAAQPVKVEIKVRQGRKHVSLITNLESFAIHAESFAAELMRTVGASASATPLPTSTAKNPKSEVFVQGDQRKAIVELLEDRHGLDKRLVRIVDTTKK